MEYVLIVALWAGYCFLHSFLICTAVTRWMSRSLKDYYAFYRVAYNALAFILLVPLIRFTVQWEGTDVFIYPYPLSIVRQVLTAVSVGIFFWAFFFDYDALSFFGIRQIINFRNGKKDAPTEGLKKTGLLGIVRHPMYLALLIFLWCQIFSMVNLVVNTVLTIYVIIGTTLEERKLIVEFGDPYVAYQHQVPMLIPFVNRLSILKR